MDSGINSAFWPNDADDWPKLAEALLGKAIVFLELNRATIERIVLDEYRNDTINEWVVRCKETLPGHVFDEIIDKASTDLGLRHLDTLKMRKKNLDSWNGRLRLIAEDADLMIEARRLVEHTLLSEAEHYLPITGKDIIQELNIEPGPKVGLLLRQARELYHESQCSKTELIERLRKLR